MSSFPVRVMAPNFDESRWVIQIRRTLDEELEENTEVPVSIFNVPKTLMVSDPDCYVPQEVALGPYHYWRPELYEIERYKVAAAKRTQKQLQNLKFQNLVEHLLKLESRIRACYHKYLNFNGETLAWMMAVDASFLLEFLHIYAVKEGKVLTTVSSSRMSHLVDAAGRKSAHNAILRDLAMLENQIPLFVLRKILELQFSSLELADDMLMAMLVGLCKELSPFKVVEIFPEVKVTESAHLLDFLYQMIVPKLELGTSEITEIHDEDQCDANQGEKNSFGKSSHVKQFLNEIWKIAIKLNKGPVHLLKRIVFSKPMKVMFKLPWTLLSNIPGLKILILPMKYLCFSQEKPQENPENENSNNPPLVEEIAIPSISELSKAGVSIVATNGGITSISYDSKKMALYLPTVNLDVNTEVILRNLVAYEACNASGPLVFTRYTELMNGIIDTIEDVALLRERGVVLNRLKSDDEVTNLWNSMSKSVKLTKVSCLDKVIEDVNKFYNGRWKVKIGKCMKYYVFESWKFLTFLAAIMLLMLMSLQAFCSVYSCSRVFKIESSGQ
ncbi:putative UPF0481 protein At3g02645 [Nicotiana tabacum]|uniref:UPF0481 protein At3g02645 n=3 Tax=Nicotiana TaxID=4085 RepID=A0A1S4DR52_TOBAC|nr:PREDICTED: putative UPF0481 protein At3g02645 [Nicotiana sylvestris]XP_016515897.1 PREDICTED: putative UPF0481 protein At3g02645 [Nicotiana tabacum]